MNFKKMFRRPIQIAVLDFSTFSVVDGKYNYDYYSALAFGNKAVNLQTGAVINLVKEQKRWENLCKVYPALKDSAVVLVSNEWTPIARSLDNYWDIALARVEEDYPF
jgi:hypothetical protein